MLGFIFGMMVGVPLGVMLISLLTASRNGDAIEIDFQDVEKEIK